jgi:hypothetical protein
MQTLADGTNITTIVKTKEVRDSQGRTVHQVTRTLPDGNQSTQTFVQDPITHTATNWSSGSTEATVDHLHDPSEMRDQVNSSPKMQQARPAPTTRPSTQMEKLGSKTILGVVAEGTRITRVIPAGSQGNDRPMTVVTEQWISPDLGIVLSSSRDDPRNGHNTQEVIELERGEPDPALFQPPAGYTVKDRNPQ